MDATAFSCKPITLPRLLTSTSSSVSIADARDRLSRRLLVVGAAPAGLRSFTLRRSSNVNDSTSIPIHDQDQPWCGVYTVGDFMTAKEELHVVKTTTTVDEALEMLVEHRITGFPVVTDDWKLVGLVSDYDLLTLDSISGGEITDNSMFPEVDCNWRTFNEIQKLLSKTNGKLVGDLMTPAPLVVKEDTNLEDAARLLLKTKYRRLPVVDEEFKMVGIITRGNVVRAALQIKHTLEGKA